MANWTVSVKRCWNAGYDYFLNRIFFIISFHLRQSLIPMSVNGVSRVEKIDGGFMVNHVIKYFEIFCFYPTLPGDS